MGNRRFAHPEKLKALSGGRSRATSTAFFNGLRDDGNEGVAAAARLSPGRRRRALASEMPPCSAWRGHAPPRCTTSPGQPGRSRFPPLQIGRRRRRPRLQAGFSLDNAPETRLSRETAPKRRFQADRHEAEPLRAVLSAFFSQRVPMRLCFSAPPARQRQRRGAMKWTGHHAAIPVFPTRVIRSPKKFLTARTRHTPTSSLRAFAHFFRNRQARPPPAAGENPVKILSA